MVTAALEKNIMEHISLMSQEQIELEFPQELQQLAKKLDEARGNTWLTLSDTLANIVYQQKGIYPNVDYYAASVYKNLGLPDDQYINIFRCHLFHHLLRFFAVIPMKSEIPRI